MARTQADRDFDLESGRNLERVASLREEVGRLRAALKPFAEIYTDIERNHPGWANDVFAGEWCGYRLLGTQFKAASEAFWNEQKPDAKP